MQCGSSLLIDRQTPESFSEVKKQRLGGRRLLGKRLDNNAGRINTQILRPVLTRIGERIKTEGHEYELEDGPVQTQWALISVPYGSIALKVFPKDVNWKEISKLDLCNKIPFISFGLSLGDRKLEAFVNPVCEGNRFGQRQLGPISYYDLSEVGSEAIRQEVDNFLKSIPLEF
jgi:hypothetical protein